MCIVFVPGPSPHIGFQFGLQFVRLLPREYLYVQTKIATGPDCLQLAFLIFFCAVIVYTALFVVFKGKFTGSSPFCGKFSGKQQQVGHGPGTILHVARVTRAYELQSPVNQRPGEFGTHVERTFLIEHPEDTLADHAGLCQRYEV